MLRRAACGGGCRSRLLLGAAADCLGEGMGWDGRSYHAIYEYFVGSSASAQFEYPFAKRSGLPYLAAQLPLDAPRAFLLINMVSGFLAVLFTCLALRARFTGLVLYAAILPLCFYLFSPLRFSVYYPFMVDPPAIFLYAVAFWGVATERHYLASAALVASCAFRESGVYYALLMPCVLFFAGGMTRRKLLGMVLLGSCGALLTSLIQLPSAGGSQLLVVACNVRDKLANPFGLMRVVAGLSMTLAPFILAASAPAWARLIKDPVGIMAVAFGGLSAFMAALGGADTTRLFYVGYPLYAFALAGLIRDEAPAKVAFLALAGLVANSFLRRIPEPAGGAISADSTGFFGIFPDHGHLAVAAALLLYWAAVFVVVRTADWPKAANLAGRFRAAFVLSR